jgi:hypothetical protein
VLATGTGAQKKDLLHRVVKKVLVHDRRTVEVWYALPNREVFEICNIWLAEPSRIRTFPICDRKMPECNSIRTFEHCAHMVGEPSRIRTFPICDTKMTKCSRFRTQRDGPPEVWFRILHVGRDLIPEAEFLEQTVEIALGSKGAFENGNVGIMTRRVTADRVVNAAVNAWRPAMPPRASRTPCVVELLRKAQEWRRLLDSKKVGTKAVIARREGISRARVTQVMGLLRLAPEIQEHVLSLPDTVRRSAITERALRPLTQLKGRQQVDAFKSLLRSS